MPDEDWGLMIAAGESRTVEFKSDRGPLSDQELVESTVCLANGEGGTLFVGVEDDGTVTGLHPKHQKEPELLPAFLASRTVPPLNVGVAIELLPAVPVPLPVAIVRVPASRQVAATSDGRIVVRYVDVHGAPGCRPMYPYEIISWQADRGQVDFSSQTVSGALWEDLDPLEFVRLRRMVETYHGDRALLNLSDLELARALGLAGETEGTPAPTVAGLLMVGREAALRDYIPAHEVTFQVLRGTDVAVNDFYRWPLLRIVERVLEGLEVRNEERELNIGLFRVGIPGYDRRAFRETLNNALTHRDYRRLGAVHIQLHQDRITVLNPGGFVQGVRPDNLLRIGPHPRNPRLADCFKRIGLVERTGRGISIIYEGQLRNGRRPPSFADSTETSVSVTLYGGSADLDFVELVLAHENDRGRILTVGELLALDHVYREREIDTATASQVVQLPESDVRSLLEGLVEDGLLDKRGTRRSRSYHLSASMYRDMGDPAAYVRARGFERLQMEQMILQYVGAHRQVTRGAVITLCKVSGNQASYLLRELVAHGKLRLVGMGRNAYYVPGDA